MRLRDRYSLGTWHSSSRILPRSESLWSHSLSWLSRPQWQPPVKHPSPHLWSSPQKCWRVSSIMHHHLLFSRHRWCQIPQRLLCHSALCRNGLRISKDACSRTHTFGNHNLDRWQFYSEKLSVCVCVCVWEREGGRAKLLAMPPFWLSWQKYVMICVKPSGCVQSIYIDFFIYHTMNTTGIKLWMKIKFIKL